MGSAPQEPGYEAKEGQIVGHVPFSLSPNLFTVLEKRCEQSFSRVTGGKVNRGTGYGLEIPCVYQFYGPKPYIDKLREVIDSLKTSGLV